MLSTVVAATALLSLASGAFAARNTTAIRDFSIYPAFDCKQGGYDLCDQSTISQLPASLRSLYNDSFRKCSANGSFCMGGICGRFLGKDNMCCSGKGNTPLNQSFSGGSHSGLSSLDTLANTADDILNNVKDACVPYQDILKDFDMSKGSKPLTENCDAKNFTSNYPVGLSQDDLKTIVDEVKSGENVTIKQCCSVDNDAISLFNIETSGMTPSFTVKNAVCIPPLGAGNSKLTYDNATGTEGGSTDSKKNFGTSLAPASFAAIVIAGIAGFGLL